MKRSALLGCLAAVAATGMSMISAPVAAAEPPPGAGVHLKALADNLRCQVTFTMDNYTNSHNWMTMDYWFSQEDQPWAPADADMHSSGWDPKNLPSPWRLVNGAKRPVARYTDKSPADSPGSLRGALPASYTGVRYGDGGSYQNFQASALKTPFTTRVTVDLRHVTPPPPPAVNGAYTLRYRVYLGPQTDKYGYWTPKSVTVRGCNAPGGFEWGSSAS